MQFRAVAFHGQPMGTPQSITGPFQDRHLHSFRIKLHEGDLVNP